MGGEISNPDVVCDDKTICYSVKEELECNIHTVVNQDFISTWL